MYWKLIMHCLDHRVRQAAQNAFENGYRDWDNTQALAIDMGTYDAELEHEELASIMASIDSQQLLKAGGPYGYTLNIS